MVKSSNLKLFNNNIIFTICILQFLFITYSLIIAHNSPAKGYEASIYAGTPFIVWFLLGLCLIVSITIILYQIKTQQVEHNNFWVISLLIIYLVYIIFLSLFIIRNYYGWVLTGDPGSHIGIVNNILSDGHFSEDLYYPILHVYVSQISLLSSLNIITLHRLVPLFFSMLYIPFMYIFAKSLSLSRNQLILVVIASSTFICGWQLNFTPNGLSNQFLPLSLYIFVKTINQKEVKWEILLIIIVLFYPVFHPLPTLFLVILILSFNFPTKIYYFYKNGGNLYTENRNTLSKFKLTLALVLVIWGITWISSFGIWERTIHNIYDVFNEEGPNKIDAVTNDVNTAEGYGYSTTQYVVKVFGSIFIYFLFSLFSIPLFVKKKRFYHNLKLNNFFCLYGPLFCIVILTVAFFLFNFMFGPMRMIFYLVLICSIFTGFFLDHVIIDSKKTNNLFLSKVAVIGIIILLIGIFFNGISMLYPSKYILASNPQVTEGHFDGMVWLLEDRNTSLEITGISISPYRISRILSIPEKEMQSIHFSFPKLPLHFGYNNCSSLSEYYVHKNNLYAVITEKDKVIAKYVFPEIAELRWTSKDFERLNFDFGVNKIYSNKELEIFYINTMKEEDNL